MIEVAEVYSHRALFLSFPAERRARKQAHLFECAVMFVVIEIIGTCVVSYVQVGPAVIVVVSPGGSQAVVFREVADSCLLGNVLKCPIAAIVEKEVRLALHSPWPALHQETLVAAIMLVAARFRKFVDVYVNIARHEQIDKTISIVVCPSCACCQPIYLQSSALGHVFEFAVAQVAIKRSSSVPGHKQIQSSVIIEVRDRDPHAPTLAGQAGLLCDVREMKIRILVIERDQQVATLPKAIHRRSVYHHDVQLAVVVAIEESYATAHGLEDISLLTGNMGDRQTGRPGNILKMRIAVLRIRGNRKEDCYTETDDARNSHEYPGYPSLVYVKRPSSKSCLPGPNPPDLRRYSSTTSRARASAIVCASM